MHSPFHMVSYLLIGLVDDRVEEPLGHLAGPVLPPLQRVVQEAFRGGGYHRGNQGTDGPRCLKEIEQGEKRFFIAIRNDVTFTSQ